MRFFALASDYDGTLAHHAKVDPDTIAAVRRFKESGRKFILVTGREMHELLEIFPEANLCDRIVAENGALLYNPATRQERQDTRNFVCFRILRKPMLVTLENGTITVMLL